MWLHRSRDSSGLPLPAEVTVELGDRAYPVHIGQGAMERLPGVVHSIAPQLVVIITDTSVNELYGERIESALTETSTIIRLEVDAGENVKTLESASLLLRKLAELGVMRGDLIVSLGGGVVSDLAGFVASVYQRGMSVVHLPTTLLGQVDAAIGGKTGVNLPAGKNLIGTIHQPSAVIADTGLLSSLPAKGFISGVAEVIKYGLCYDEGLLSLLSQGPLEASSPWLDEIVTTCVQIKARVVAEDESDADARLVLNYGHTLGHAIEAATGYGAVMHGEAISAGMVFAAELAHSLEMLGEEAVGLHRELLERNGLPVTTAFDSEEVMRAMQMDKKRMVSQRWVLLHDIAKPVVRDDIDDGLVRACLGKVQSS